MLGGKNNPRNQDAMESILIFVLKPEETVSHNGLIVRQRSVWLFYQKDWKGLDYRCVLGDKISATKELLNVIKNNRTRSNVCKAKSGQFKNSMSFFHCPTTMWKKSEANHKAPAPSLKILYLVKQCERVIRDAEFSSWRPNWHGLTLKYGTLLTL